MRKLGLRTLAGGLAVLMTVSVLGPVTPARAENDLLIAPAPTAVNTLYVTKDMVDSDNEIIISGEKWDRIVVAKEAAAANIYFDEVEVGELVVESGSDSTIQLWKVDAGKVTVKEPELKEIDVTTLKSLLVEEETRQQAIDYFLRVQAENEKTLRQAPKLVTMEDAVVDTVSAGANVVLDLHEGEVKALNVEASDKIDRMDVTLEGYKGEVTYAGNKGFSIVNLKNVDSRIGKLTVADSSANNYLNVTSRDSVALNVEVAGDAKVSLNIPMGELNITEAAKAASVDVLNAVDNMNVSGSNAKVEIAPIGNVAKASITGDKAEIGGAGTLGEAVILGKEVYVSTKGTTVEGENCYVEPVYVAPTLPPGQNVVLEFASTEPVGWHNFTPEKVSGGVKIAFKTQYAEVVYALPQTLDLSKYDKMILSLNTSDNVAIKLHEAGAEFGACTQDQCKYGIQSGGTKKDVEISLSDFPAASKLKTDRIGIMANDGAANVTLYSVTFVPKAGVTVTPDPTPGGTGTPEVPPEKPPADGTPCKSNQWEVHNFTEYDLKEYAGKTVEISVSMMKTGGSSDSVKTNAQCNDPNGPAGSEYAGYTMVAGEQMITGEWQVFCYTWTVPEKFAASNAPEKPIYFGFRFDNCSETGDFYKGYKFYYKDFSFKEVGTTTPDGDTSDTSVSVKITAPAKTTLAIKETLTLKAEVTPEGKEVTWSSSNEAIATVDATGTVTAVSGGAVKITATCGEAKDTVDLTVEPATGGNTPGQEVPPEETPKVVITELENKTLAIGGTLTLEATVTPEGKEVTWSSSDAAIAEVDATGKVTAKAAGTVTITATCGEATAEVELTVVDNSVECVSNEYVIHNFTEKDLRQYAGGTIQLRVKMKKTGGKNESVLAPAQTEGGKNKVIKWDQQITNDWTEFTYIWDVPSSFENETNPVYFGFRKADPKTQYDGCTFFYKDFSFVGVPAEKAAATLEFTAEDENVTVTKLENGSVTIASTDEEKGAIHTIPTEINAKNRERVALNVTVTGKFAVGALDESGYLIVSSVRTVNTYYYPANPITITYPFDLPEGTKAIRIVPAVGKDVVVNSLCYSSKTAESTITIDPTAAVVTGTATKDTDGNSAVINVTGHYTDSAEYSVLDKVEANGVVYMKVNLASSGNLNVKLNGFPNFRNPLTEAEDQWFGIGSTKPTIQFAPNGEAGTIKINSIELGLSSSMQIVK